MANHCWNYVDFWGNPEGLRRLLGSLETLEKKEIEESVEVRYADKDSVFLNGLTFPKILSETPLHQLKARGINSDVYELYGSKWFDCSWEATEENGVITNLVVKGDSAWSPMVPLFVRICKKLKLQCSGNYEEPGMDFAGEFEINEFGNVMENQMTYRQYQATNNPNSYWEDIIISIEEGHFESLEDIFEDFRKSGWILSDSEKRQVTEEWENFQKSTQNED